jgi:hypothetical protein
MIIAAILPLSCAFEVSPNSPSPGETITISGRASPGQEISLSTSFGMGLPVEEGRYEYQTKVTVPQTPNRITVAAENVKDFNAGIKLGIWITKGFPPSGGKVRLSQANVPAGEYNLKMFGEAQPGSGEVGIEVEAETRVKADSQGRYALDVDTSGIPAGEYRIEVAGEAKNIQIGGTASSVSVASSPSKPTASRPQTESDLAQGSSRAKSLEITLDVVRWYANETGLKIENQSQFDQAERLLEKRLAGGYWKIIVRGEPLTEEAGNCLQQYCLVRSKGTCTGCRDKEIIVKGKRQPPAPALNATEKSDSTDGQPQEKAGLWNRIAGWIGIGTGLVIQAGGAASHSN